MDRSKIIAIVESEKTAIVCSALLPRFIWLATGGLGNMNPELFEPLKGRDLVLFPDLGAYDHWTEKASLLKGLGNTIVSDFLERNAPAADKSKGYDLADYFINSDPKAGYALTSEGYPAFWDIPTGSCEVWTSQLHALAAEGDPLARMIAKNPALSLLIDRFDLQLEHGKTLP